MNRIHKQMAAVDKALATKPSKGISFIRMIDRNTIEYINIPNSPHQTFVYLNNTSKLTHEQRAKIKEEKEMIRLLSSPVVKEEL